MSYKLPFKLKFSQNTWKNFSVLSFAQVAAVLVGLITSALWARYLPQETYGKYQLLLSFYTMLGVFCLGGMGTSLQISAAKGFDGNLLKITKLKFSASLLGALAFVGIGIYYWESDRALAIGSFVFVFFFPLRQLETIWISWINGKGLLELVAKIRIILLLPSLLAVATVVGFGYIQLPVLIVISQSFVGIFIIGVLVYIFIFQRDNKNEDQATINYGFHLTGALLLGWLVSTDKFIINEYFLSEEVAIYAVALIFPNQVVSLFTIFNQIITPHITKANSVREAWKYLRPRFLLLNLIFALLGITGFFLFPVIIPLIFSGKYIAAVPYAKWMWLTLNLNTPTTYLANILRAQKKIKFSYCFEIVHPLLSATLYAILIPQFGVWGAVLTKIIGHIFGGLFFVGSFLWYLKTEEN